MLPKISHRRSLVNAKQHLEDGAMAHAYVCCVSNRVYSYRAVPGVKVKNC